MYVLILRVNPKRVLAYWFTWMLNDFTDSRGTIKRLRLRYSKHFQNTRRQLGPLQSGFYLFFLWFDSKHKLHSGHFSICHEICSPIHYFRLWNSGKYKFWKGMSSCLFVCYPLNCALVSCGVVDVSDRYGTIRPPSVQFSSFPAHCDPSCRYTILDWLEDFSVFFQINITFLFLDGFWYFFVFLAGLDILFRFLQKHDAEFHVLILFWSSQKSKCSCFRI